MGLVIVNMKKELKQIISLIFILVIFLQCNLFAKVNPFEKEVDSPIAEQINNISEGIIISDSPYHEYNPLNPIKPGINKNEYEAVDNYIIDLKTIELRIKYFSPTYKNIKANAESMYWMAYYARGGNDNIVYNFNSYTEEINNLMYNLKSAMNNAISERQKYNENDAEYDNLTALISNYSKMYIATLTQYKTIKATKSALGLSRALYNVGNVDNNNQVSFARRAVTKSIKSLVMTYLQLSSYTEVLEKQSKLYYDIYVLKKKNLELGLSTQIEVKQSLDTYETSKQTYNATKTTLKNVKEQIAINLGYRISEIDKLEFIEPIVDLDSINAIDYDKDKEKAYTSNVAYKSVTLNDKDRKLPGSTGEDLLHKRQDYNAEKVITEFENIYRNLQAKVFEYEGSIYLQQIVSINEAANYRKFTNNLISELEYKGLEIQNLANSLQIKISKYNLINAYNDYYYGALGHITIS